MNYRLAPQYPFPCALQDIIATCNYSHITLPLQFRDELVYRSVLDRSSARSGAPRGQARTYRRLGRLCWRRSCDCPSPGPSRLRFTVTRGWGAYLALVRPNAFVPKHSHKHSNGTLAANDLVLSAFHLMCPPQDVIPPYGLSFYKPSTLWPPPPEDMTDVVRESLRSRIRQAVTATTASLSTYANRQHSGSASRSNSQSRPPSPAVSHDLRLQTGQTLHLGSTASLPIAQAGGRDQTVSCVTKDGEVLSIHQQIHLYTPNFMLPHPLISPVVSYLGGLPPLLVIAGDAEVLRDEIIYLYA